ncbi:ABC transporter ATP-binding protein [Kribbella sp. NPDC000426]|uniref:ABC transporter ATP-binding protein n=1 Tax=Kribbella sp. NPDC000426 TaxID=3154255 RepID=UPI003324442E
MSTVERLDEAVRLTGVSAYGVRFTDLVVRYGEVVVLAGPNGSGKSTISRVVVGELTSAGSVQVLGADPVAADLKGRIGYLVKDLETMGSLTSRDVLDICAAVRGCDTTYAHQLADRLGLDLDRPMATLCRGQLRRLGIVQALMHRPELVVMDDPMTELDDEARSVVPALLHEAAARGAAVLITAQSESDAEHCADRIVPLTSIVPGGLEAQQAYDGQRHESCDNGDRDHPDRDPRRTAPPRGLLDVRSGLVNSHLALLSHPAFRCHRREAPAVPGRRMDEHGPRGGDPPRRVSPGAPRLLSVHLDPPAPPRGEGHRSVDPSVGC